MIISIHFGRSWAVFTSSSAFVSALLILYINHTGLWYWIGLLENRFIRRVWQVTTTGERRMSCSPFCHEHRVHNNYTKFTKSILRVSIRPPIRIFCWLHLLAFLREVVNRHHQLTEYISTEPLGSSFSSHSGAVGSVMLGNQPSCFPDFRVLHFICSISFSIFLGRGCLATSELLSVSFWSCSLIRK